ncbi:MAG: sigma-E processing peptidase SpoIIGA [Negativicutes bacterium]|nr:sigma-E processing peptidase SpoIIGA [Negativicutes bacterium]
MYIYADVFLVLNIVLNSIILVLAAWSAGIPYRVWRILTAAVFGSVYALGGLAGEYVLLYSPPVKLLVSVIIVILAFPAKSFRLLLTAIAAFYLVSLLLGGAIIGWLLFAQSGDSGLAQGIAWARPAWTHLAAGTAIVFGLAFLTFRHMAANRARRPMLFPLILSYGGRQIELTALLDTGNQLFSLPERTPVVLITERALAPLLSEAVKDYLKTTEPVDWLAHLDRCQDFHWLSRIQIIPYRAVGASSMLLGFRPDCLVVLTKAGRIETNAVVVGIYSGNLAADDTYHALLHPVVMQFANTKEGAGICA